MIEARLTEDTLFLACTRPAMVWGVPMEAMGINLIVTGLAFLIGGSLAWLALALVLHAVFRGVCATDHNAFRVLSVWLETRGRARNGSLWGGSSCTPLPLHRVRRPRERHA
ncbi:MAG: type IV secretion system protein VirB3 [Phenylobacterium sp.]|uniref:type IV secretion system protein VirB3 n=1 Tax=Phenylobacterium sp. TaxID=1871053 RepID=UPI002733006A|nr:type IV secretion system protein VirB3 [Phenylobacterium sp.]MDP3749294.1 type IV secretion system protein VirB3 [Phenylobacterium sp.]